MPMDRSYAALSMALVVLGCDPADPGAVCRARPPFTPANQAGAVPVLLRFDNQMGPQFRAVGLCITIDDQVVPFTGAQEEEAVAAFAHHKLLEVRAPLHPGVPHSVHVFATFRGVGTELERYKFDLYSEHRLDVETLRPGVLRCNFVERPEADLVQRPGVAWVDPGVSAQ